ncbi:hypothetical protein P3S67_027814 [Capsicum chacoense]|uniref:uncharacterized protein LOC107870048 n=1 Tax=Capsicum annuum TaxID=4072 RepID=UPI001FB13407|nr:uncharacterized protein LOC107870048 [Capsicum annuum]XP_047268310.1 uncharacterized protein LOC124898657 [Capsicum annuum]
MASSCSSPSTFSSFNSQITPLLPINYTKTPHTKLSFSFSSLSVSCFAAKQQEQQQTGPVKKKQQRTTSSSSTKKKKKPVQVDVEVEGDKGVESFQRYTPLPLPKPPAGFVLDEQGSVLMASSKRIATIVDSTNNFPLECVIRRVFRSTRGDECLLLCPVDMPVQILKSRNVEGWAAVSDEEVEAILPTAAYALAKIHMHLVYSGFCYTARGGFCYTEDDIFEFRTDGEDVDGLPSEGIEITCFHMDGSHYMIYTPSDPLLFVASKDKDGLLQIADDELLEDPAIISAIDEETEFNALVEEEAALLESLLGER